MFSLICSSTESHDGTERNHGGRPARSTHKKNYQENFALIVSTNEIALVFEEENKRATRSKKRMKKDALRISLIILPRRIVYRST